MHGRDDDLRGVVRPRRQAADRAAEDGRRQPLPADLDRPSGGGRDPDEAAGRDAPRPLTHDLLVNILGELDVEVVRVTVTELRENTFHASITVAQNGNEVEIDSRSSDAIAVAVRAQAPIFAADDVIEESAIEMEGDEVNEEEIVDEFKRFLDHVSAEDFAEAELEELLEDDDEEEAEDDGER